MIENGMCVCGHSRDQHRWHPVEGVYSICAIREEDGRQYEDDCLTYTPVGGGIPRDLADYPLEVPS